MTQFNIVVGTVVEVTKRGGGLFYSNNYGKRGTVYRVSDDLVYVDFSEGNGSGRDYGRKGDVTIIRGGQPVAAPVVPGVLAVGARVKVTQHQGGAFYARSYDLEGVVTELSDIAVHVAFDNGTTDYGRKEAVTVLTPSVAKDAQGFIQNTTKAMPVKRGTVLDVLYNDGTLILDLPVGDGTTKKASNNSNSYSATTWSGHGSAGIKAYRFATDRAVTLDDQLASLKAELTAIEAREEAAQTKITEATAELAAATAEKEALQGRLTKHGIQFVPEVIIITAYAAFEAGNLEVGTTLLAVTPRDEGEHTPGKTYKVTQRDRGDSSEFKLESNDGYGWWIRNEELANYTVVA